MNRPKIAIITRTKDRTLLLERAIKSVHLQSYKDFVHVIINDAGDTQAVDELVDKHSAIIDGRVKIIHNSKSQGMEAASNKAIGSVGSEYIAVHDDDDSWHPDFLKLSLDRLQETKAAGVVVRTDKVTEEIGDNSVQILKTETWMPDMKAVSLYRQCIDNQMTPITFMYKRSVYSELGGYDEELPVLGDWDFGIRFIQKYDVEFLDPGFALANYHHRKPTGSASDSNFGSGQEKHRYWSNKLMNKYLRQELNEGRLGAGYIMSKERYQQGYISRLAYKILPRSIASRLKKRAQS